MTETTESEPLFINASDAVGTLWRCKGDPENPKMWRPAFYVVDYDPKRQGILSIAIETCGWIGPPGHVNWNSEQGFRHSQHPERGPLQIVQVKPEELTWLIAAVPDLMARPGTPPDDKDMETARKAFYALRDKLQLGPFSTARDRILVAKKVADETQAGYEAIVKKEHEDCPHPIEHIIEGKWLPGDTWTIGCGGGTYSTSEPPFRVCRLCGYAEEGWGSGYWKLKTPIGYEMPEISREGAKKLITGQKYTQSDLYKLRYPERFTNREDSAGNPKPLWAWKEIE